MIRVTDLPPDIEAQSRVIGEVLTTPAHAQAVFSLLTPDDFTGVLKGVFRALREVLPNLEEAANAGAEADLLSVLRAWRHVDPSAAEMGGLEYLVALKRLAVGFQEPTKYCAPVKEFSLRRQLFEVAEKIAELARSAPPREALEGALAEVHAVQAAARLDPSLPAAPVESVRELLGTTEWLWHGWLPKGYLTVLAGEPGIGKSLLALYLCKVAVMGEPWPDGQDNTAPVPAVLFADCEGCQALTAERATKLGMPPQKLFLPGEDGLARLVLNDKSQMAQLRQAILEQEYGIIVVDSLRSALGAEVDENDSRLAAILTQWADLARDYNIAVLLVHHFKKKPEGQTDPTLDRLRGSSTIGALARCVIALDKPDPENPAARLSVVKSNLGPLPKPLGLHVTTEGLLEFDLQAPRPPRRDTMTQQAEEFLLTLLDHHPLRWGELRAQAAEQGISKNALYRARDNLGIVVLPDPTDPSGRGKLWSLPGHSQKVPTEVT